MEHVCRITRAYTDIVCVFSDWTKVSDKVLVYEHPAGISRRTKKHQKKHCHVLIEGCTIGIEALKKRVKFAKLRGNEDWSFSLKDYTGPERYISYMTKGKYEPSYNKGYEPHTLEQLKSIWVDYPEQPMSAPPLVQAIPKDSLISTWAEYTVHFEKWWKNKQIVTISQIQKEARKFWYKHTEHHLFPTGSQQKRFISSIYYHYKMTTVANYEENDYEFEELNKLT